MLHVDNKFLESGRETCLSPLVRCSAAVSLWFHQNALLLNPDKTEAVFFATRQRLVSEDFSHTIKVACADIQFSI